MRFYRLDDDTQSQQYATIAEGISRHLGNAPKCPVCNAVCDSLQWLPPYKIEIRRRGKYFGDIVRASCGDLVVTEAFRQAWIESKLVGVDSFDPMEVVRVKPKKATEEVPVYWHAAVKLSLTAVNMAKSHFVRIIGDPVTCTYCAPGFDGVAGFEIDIETWSGEDIFRPRNMVGSIIVSELFVDMVHKYDLTHAVLIPTEKYIFDPLHLIVPYTESKA